MAGSVRAVALKILLDAEKNATFSNIALDRALVDSSLSVSDRGLLSAMVLGVIERRLTLDAVIDFFASEPKKIERDARVLLRLGIYQIAFLDKIPDHAAVNETVALAPRRLRGFVNAILRSYLRAQERGEGEAMFPQRNDDAIGYLSLKYSFPREVCEKFCEIYGYERTEDIFEIFNRAPAMTLRINTLKISRSEYARLLDGQGIEYTLSKNLGDALKVKGVAFSALPGANEGYFFVQDEASQMCVDALGAENGDRVIDVCSCPGSKSFGTAIRMKNMGEIFSFDLHKSKLSLIETGAERLGIDIISASERDGRKPCESLFGQADRVLCDVPCSGLGVIAKKPEIRYKSLSEFERLPEIQYDILSASANYVKVGGILVYSTCTVLPEENSHNVERFLSEHDEFETVEFTVGGKTSEGGMLSLSPDRDGTDGFFIAKMRRRG